ncbi:MAG TPA: anti-sigma factor [Acidimicrobiales bacterium]|jgi:anti-sigma factor RsiW|nr:anti-sigma factor [Acidimicrobiales bacterium]
MSHEEASELLGAYALDAVDGDEFVELERHLATCPRCQSELDSLHEVAAALGNSVEPLPEGLWAKVASRLPEGGPDEEPPPMPRLEPASRSPFRAPSSGRTRRTRNTVVLLATAAVAAAAVAVVLGIDLVRSQDNVSGLQDSVSKLHSNVSRLQTKANQSPVAVALRTPGHRMVTLDSSSGRQLAQFVITSGGNGFLVSSVLPKLSSGQTYQLWGIVGTTPISLGLLGSSPRVAAFTIAGAPWASKLAVTAEPSGGTVAPTGSIVASGTV